MTTPNELSEYTKKTIREHEEWNKDWGLCLPDELFDFIEQEILEAERRGEARMKERCIEAFEPKKSEGDNWIYNMYSDTSVQKNIRSIK